MAALISGRGSFSRNYSSHLEDRILKGPFGGGHSTMRFSLTVLYNDFLRHMNFWTKSNQDLELARYFGVTFTFYRHPTEDFIITYNRKTPLGGNILTAPSLHPGNCMLSKRKILLPSLETRPKGKKTKKLRIGPPTLFTDKWYFQKDICDLTLLNLNVVQADLRFPFCSPQTDNICVNFQVLSSVYNGYLDIHHFDNASEETQAKEIQTFLKTVFKDQGTKLTSFNALNTFRTEGCASHPQLKKPTSNSNPPSTVQTNKYFAQLDGLWGDPIYANSLNSSNGTSTVTADSIIKILVDNMKSYYQKFKDEGFPTSWYGNMANCHLTGIYSPIYLNAGRISPEIPGLYTEILYNPYTDKGKGNKVWLDPLTKKDNIYTPPQSKCLILDMPLWCAVFGYQDWIKKELNHWDAPFNYRVVFNFVPYNLPENYTTQPDAKLLATLPISDQFWGRDRCHDGSNIRTHKMERKVVPQTSYTNKMY